MNNFVIVFVFVTLCLWGGKSPIFAKLPADAKKIQKHLEYLGYEVKVDQKVILAEHSNRVNIIVMGYPEHLNGILIQAVFTGTEYAKNHTEKLIPLINRVNKKAICFRAYMDKDYDLTLESWYTGAYDRKRFGLFLDQFNKGVTQLAQVAPEISKFVK